MPLVDPWGGPDDEPDPDLEPDPSADAPPYFNTDDKD
jgi:hypothetical protein